MTQFTDPHQRSTPEDVKVRRIIAVLLLALAAWGSAIFTWGLPALFLPALALVPVIMVFLVIITRGK